MLKRTTVIECVTVNLIMHHMVIMVKLIMHHMAMMVK